MIGRYPDYDVLESRASWDEATAQVVDHRPSLVSGGPLSFFSAREAATVRAFCDTCVANDSDPRVPIAEMIDEKLAAGRLDGYQYADMPDDRDTWHQVLAGLDETASRYGTPNFAALDRASREALVGELAKGRLGGGSFQGLNVSRAFSVCMRMILAAFYAHPWAWNEIGSGGPAYPRGYMRLGGVAVREPFERPGATSEDPVRLASELDE